MTASMIEEQIAREKINVTRGLYQVSDRPSVETTIKLKTSDHVFDRFHRLALASSLLICVAGAAARRHRATLADFLIRAP
jgi:hypothetical protein